VARRTRGCGVAEHAIEPASALSDRRSGQAALLEAGIGEGKICTLLKLLRRTSNGKSALRGIIGAPSDAVIIKILRNRMAFHPRYAQSAINRRPASPSLWWSEKNNGVKLYQDRYIELSVQEAGVL
jgi:hypothetical protein